MPSDDEEFQEQELKEVPAFETGGRVSETGIALVHKGEYILPAPGSEAIMETVEAQGQTVVNYYFPVEIVVSGSLPEEEHEVIQARIWEKLSDALDTMA